MGATPSKEEMLYQEVQNGNHDAVKSLHRDGASLEWVDKEGRTPLLLACSRGELLDMAITLLNLGSNKKAYSSGVNGGYPLHHAAKRGLEKTVTLLLSHGANPLKVNDDGQTPLDMARSRGHVAVVRLLEEKLCLFSGTLRELSGFGILESLAPNLMTKKVWAVVLPLKSHSRRAPEYELAIYESPKLSLWNGVHASSVHPAGLCNVARPHTVIPLAKAEVEELNLASTDPVFSITDKVHKIKHRFFPEIKGDKAQLQRFYRACKGLSQDEHGTADANSHYRKASDHNTTRCEEMNSLQMHPIKSGLFQGKLSSTMQPVLQSVSAPSFGNTTTVNESIAEPISEELALALALDESIRTASAEGLLVSPDASRVFCTSKYQIQDYLDVGCNGWSHQDSQNNKPKRAGKCAPKAKHSTFRRRTSSSRHTSSSTKEVSDDEDVTSAAPVAPPPTAPPLPGSAPLHYPSFDSNSRAGGACVVCWDAPAEGACIPCGHLAGCMNCLSKVKSKSWGCPVCRGLIDQVIKVYAV